MNNTINENNALNNFYKIIRSRLLNEFNNNVIIDNQYKDKCTLTHYTIKSTCAQIKKC